MARVIKTAFTILCCLLPVFSLIPCAESARLPPSVLAALQQAQIPLANIGVVVREVNSPKPLISINGTQPMNPASTMKLLTTYAGLELLGPAYTWKTEAWLDGKLEDGVLQGNLILKGYGDPKLTLEQFWLWLRELRGRGLREIHGNVILDRSVFQLAAYDPATFDNDPIRPYNVGADALLINFNSLRLQLIPGAAGLSAVTEPKLAGFMLDNRLELVADGDCSHWEDAVIPQLIGSTIVLQGTFPATCGERYQHLSLMSHTRFLNALFLALWQELGGTLSGEMLEGSVPSSAVLLATHYSTPLSEIIRDINKFSNNVMARQLFLSLSIGAASPATIPRSVAALHDWLQQKQLFFDELVLENGAGLSRAERISPLSMSLLLQAAQASPLHAEFEASLPLLGVDGTLKKRLRDSKVASYAHLKTGSLEGVKAIAGYLQSQHGKRWILVFFINHPNAPAAIKAQDALIDWVWRQY
jgi:D-alanyl-D-alanine carboxypeptidase/D-alanyl-D-alanine-endopeptidase (penicillin-binding protein 4)